MLLLKTALFGPYICSTVDFEELGLKYANLYSKHTCSTALQTMCKCEYQVSFREKKELIKTKVEELVAAYQRS